ncbi:unnamed protein product [Pedinophyceae sp. YPF-701]|nr:unnamed protein product [Pedinophyceae sp. YPF-701]
MAGEDYYKLLGVDRSANESEIKKAFYKAAKRYHPDANKDDPDAQKKFTEIKKAYETLRDPEKRRVYDQLGAEGAERMEQGGGPGGDPFGGAGGPFGGPFGGFGGFGGPFGGPGGGFRDMDDILNQFFGQQFGGAARRSSRLDMRLGLRLSFLEACNGCDKTLEVGGRSLRVQIPPGVEAGQRLMMEGHGREDPASGARGHLFLEVMVEPHPVLRREGSDIIADVTVSVATAALGGQVTVPTIDGDVVVRINPGTQPGQRLVLRGKGLRMPMRGRADQYVDVDVSVPKRLTARQKELFEELRAELEKNS